MPWNTLIDPETLAAHANDPAWCVFDCRHELARPDFGELAYRQAHIPNARFLHLDRDLSGPKNGRNGRHPLPDPGTLAAALARNGVSNDAQVVAYDDAGGMYAARLWWLLRWLGHDAVAVLDGGLPAWERAGYPLTAATTVVTPSTFEWRADEKPINADYLLSHLHDPDLLLVDSRGADRFRGENETLDPVAGHIPGAVNRPFRENLTSDGCCKPAATLHGEFQQLLEGRPTRSLVAYCGSGVSACLNLLALEHAGFRGARLYAGSWSEWCSDNARPVSIGVDPASG